MSHSRHNRSRLKEPQACPTLGKREAIQDSLFAAIDPEAPARECIDVLDFGFVPVHEPTDDMPQWERILVGIEEEEESSDDPTDEEVEEAWAWLEAQDEAEEERLDPLDDDPTDFRDEDYEPTHGSSWMPLLTCDQAREYLESGSFIVTHQNRVTRKRWF